MSVTCISLTFAFTESKWFSFRLSSELVLSILLQALNVNFRSSHPFRYVSNQFYFIPLYFLFPITPLWTVLTDGSISKIFPSIFQSIWSLFIQFSCRISYAVCFQVSATYKSSCELFPGQNVHFAPGIEFLPLLHSITHRCTQTNCALSSSVIFSRSHFPWYFWIANDFWIYSV